MELNFSGANIRTCTVYNTTVNIDYSGEVDFSLKASMLLNISICTRNHRTY